MRGVRESRGFVVLVLVLVLVWGGGDGGMERGREGGREGYCVLSEYHFKKQVSYFLDGIGGQRFDDPGSVF